jgi:hypothetical protein
MRCDSDVGYVDEYQILPDFGKIKKKKLNSVA